jgi:hypothetical protein
MTTVTIPVEKYEAMQEQIEDLKRNVIYWKLLHKGATK